MVITGKGATSAAEGGIGACLCTDSKFEFRPAQPTLPSTWDRELVSELHEANEMLTCPSTSKLPLPPQFSVEGEYVARHTKRSTDSLLSFIPEGTKNDPVSRSLELW